MARRDCSWLICIYGRGLPPSTALSGYQKQRYAMALRISIIRFLCGGWRSRREIAEQTGANDAAINNALRSIELVLPMLSRFRHGTFQYFIDTRDVSPEEDRTSTLRLAAPVSPAR